jgi:hypothetical protein
MIHIKKNRNVYLTYNQLLKYGFRGARPFTPLKYAHDVFSVLVGGV